jgi:alkanesulfonate monooxygenase SsuD/methylene tetrahydromethanopterin reductase-like flavin-dependent oxidoreductase (luciferase family)
VGADFEERNELFDEALEVLRGIWTTRGYHHEGRHFTSLAQTALPVPVQPGGVPIWIAGNSRQARRRAATVGQGWAPLQIDADRARTVRTPPLATLADVAAGVADLRALCVEAGRNPAEVEVQVESSETGALAQGRSLREHSSRLRELAGVGVGWFVVDTPSASVDVAVDALHRYGEEVIAELE